MADSIDLNSQLDSVRQDDDDPMLETRIILVGSKVKNNKELQDALKHFKIPVLQSETGREFIVDSDDYDTIFILSGFDDGIYSKLHRTEGRILAPPVVIRCAQKNEPLPFNQRPLYCQSMQQLIICFTGFKKKEELSRLADLVHHMGGSIRKDFSPRVTHLVANCTGGEKYRAAVSLGTPIMQEAWIHEAWDLRSDVMASAVDDIMNRYKISPFFRCVLTFHGFQKEEERHMEELTVENGGAVAAAGSPDATHLVVDDVTTRGIPFETHSKLHIVKGEWFWGSLQMEACAEESMYLFESPEFTPKTRQSTPHLSGSRTRKRKRLLRENLAQLANEVEVESPMYPRKRRSGEMGRRSMSASFLDATNDSHVFDTPKDQKEPEKDKEPVKMTARQQVVMELLHTEKNYVGILHTIIKIFKEEIERPDQPGGPILSAQDVKQVFGNIPPIYAIHNQIAEELEEVTENWTDEQSVGDIFIKHIDEAVKAYPPFVNFFEKTKETIQRCDRNQPRFHAFLKVCQSKAECGRQTLTELLINPVQRLPRYSLLLADILKRTNKTNPDYAKIETALAQLKNIMTHINEDKRKTEGQVVMFDIVNDIDNCPPYLLSSNRAFIMRIDGIELSDELSGRGDHVSLFLFSDSLEMCKRRNKLSAKSPAGGAKTPQKAFKHLEIMTLPSIKRVVNIVETEECKNVFALVCRQPAEVREKLYSFTMESGGEHSKEDFLKTLCRHMANTVCRTDYENFLASMDAKDLDIDASDINNKNKMVRFGKRVSRAFSFNKTPRKLRRAMSSVTQVMSPFSRRDSLYQGIGMSTPRGPGGDLGARLASSTDLTDSSNTLISSMSYSVIPENTLSVSGLNTPSENDLDPTLIKKPRWTTLSPLPTPYRVPSTDKAPNLSYAKIKNWRKSRKDSKQPQVLEPLRPDAESPIMSVPCTPGMTPSLSHKFIHAATLAHTPAKKLI